MNVNQADLQTRIIKEFGHDFQNLDTPAAIIRAMFERIDRAEVRVAELEQHLFEERAASEQRTRVTELEASIVELLASKAAQTRLHQERVAELEHSLSDAMDQIEAIQGSNAVHMARVAELEELSQNLEMNRIADLEAAQAPRPMSETPPEAK